MPTRRTVLAGAMAAVLTRPGPARALGRFAAADRPHLEAALRAERWIRRSRQTAGGGIVWPADPLKPAAVSTELYSGTAGIVLFYLELFHATGDSGHLHEAQLGARHLLTAVPGDGSSEPGLYTGLAGIAYVLSAVGVGAGPREFRDGATDALDALVERARPAGAGLAWNDVTDVIGGSAGIGLTLLGPGQELGVKRATETARRAGLRLLEMGHPAEGGLTWMMSPTFPRNMPNFSHGTAGVAYFLARLHEATGERRFLDGAIAGATYLRAVAVTHGDGCVIRHHDGDGDNLFYLGWCHGPVGTARLFYQLGRLTGDDTWMSWLHRLQRGIPAFGVPEQRSAGFWNNISQCCGNAGVAQFGIDLHRSLPDPTALPYARRVTADLMARATAVEDGLAWVQAENRTEPDNLVAQTGFMQGAAGVGTMLLHLDAVERGERPLVTLPDSPF
jgi:lantibiotic modifying enzyme